MHINLKRKNILILGGSSDIGIELIKQLLKDNWEIVSHYSSNSKNLLNLAKKNNRLKIFKFNFQKFNEKNQKKLFKKFNNVKFDALVNLVGYVDNISHNKISLESMIKSISINSLIPFLIEKEVIKKMLKNKYGRILNCSSIGVKFGGGKNSYNYALSKHCLEFIPNLYKDWARKNIFINNLRIGVTDTKIHKKMKKTLNIKNRLKLIPVGKMAKSQDIVNYIIFLISKNNFVTGETITIAGGE